MRERSFFFVYITRLYISPLRFARMRLKEAASVVGSSSSNLTYFKQKPLFFAGPQKNKLNYRRGVLIRGHKD